MPRRLNDSTLRGAAVFLRAESQHRSSFARNPSPSVHRLLITDHFPRPLTSPLAKRQIPDQEKVKSDGGLSSTPASEFVPHDLYRPA